MGSLWAIDRGSVTWERGKKGRVEGAPTKLCADRRRIKRAYTRIVKGAILVFVTEERGVNQPGGQTIRGF